VGPAGLAPATSVQPAAAVKPSEDAFAAGERAFDAGKWDEAAKQFQAAVKRAPKDVRAWHDLGATASRQHDFAGAERAYQAALEVDPTFAPSLVQLGQLYRSNQRIDQEVSLLEKATQAPALAHQPQLLLELATAYRLKKDFAHAEATCRRVLARSQDDVEALGVLARIYLDQGNDRLAGFVAAKASKLSPDDARLHNDLGLIALKLGKPGVALAELQRSVQLDPTFAQGYLNLGALALRYRDYATAAQDLAKATALRPDDLSLHLAYAWALDGVRAGDPTQAARAGAEYEKALALAPKSAEALCGAAWAYAADREAWEKAKVFLTRCKDAEGTEAAERQRIDAKLQAIALATPTPTPIGAPERKDGVGGSGATPAAPSEGKAATPDGVLDGAGGPVTPSADPKPAAGDPASAPAAQAASPDVDSTTGGMPVQPKTGPEPAPPTADATTQAGSAPSATP